MGQTPQPAFLHNISNYLTALLAGDFHQKLPETGTPEELEIAEKLRQVALQMASAKTLQISQEREQEIVGLVDSIPVHFAYYDLEEKNVLANWASGEFFGRLPSEMKGRSLREIVGPAFYEEIRSTIKDVLEGQHKTEERQLALPFGTVKCFLWSYIPKIDEGKVTGFYVSVSDMTEVRQTQGELEQLIAAIEELAIVDVADTNGKIVRVNRNFCEVTGYRSEEVIGREKKELNAGLHSKELSEELQKTISSGKAWKGVMQGKSKRGETYWVQAIIAPIFNLGGQISKFVGVKFDITAEKMALQKLVQSSRLTSLGEMAGGIAHEINNPLTIIQGKATQLRRKLAKEGKVEGPMVSEFATQLDKIEVATMRIAKIINGLRTFARGRETDPFVTTEVSQIVNDTLELCREKFRNHQIELRVAVPDKLTIECRPSQISQVLINLLYNSLDAVEPLTERWVEIAAAQEGEQVVLTVTDSGNGIAPATAEKIMNPFFTTKDVGRGSGLGLSTAKGIAETHNGTLEYDASSPRTRFRLALVAKQPMDMKLAA